MNCKDCLRFKRVKKPIGRCKFANKRSVSLLTIKWRTELANVMKEKKQVSKLILESEESCSFFDASQSIS